MRIRIIAVLAAVVCAAHGEASDTPLEGTSEVSFEQLVVSTLGSQLLSSEPQSLLEVVRSLASRTQSNDEQVRGRLLALIDTLEWQRKEETEAWQQIRESGGPRVAPKKVEKLVRELTKRARKALQKNRDEALGELLRHGSRKADLPEYRARAVLLEAMDIDTDGASVYLGFESRVGMLFEVTDAFQQATSADGVQFGRGVGAVSANNPIAQDDVNREIASYVVQTMRSSKHVAWISSRPTSRMQPDCRLVFGIRQFNTTNRQYGSGENVVYRPAIYLDAQIVMHQLSTSTEVLRENIVVQYEFAVERDDTVRGQGSLSKFYQKAAEAVVEVVDAYLAR